jgi:hypothetical protein
MKTKLWVTSAIALGLVLDPTSAAWGQAYKPFTPVTSVCPSCTTGPQYDRIVLRNGIEIRARLIAENEVFYVLEKFGELRAVGRAEVATIEKNRNVERPAGFQDQILFKDGIVFAGALTESHGGDAFEIIIPPSTTPAIAPRAAVAYVYRAGKAVFVAGKDQ